ncbi:polyadenylate-binding protein RBP47-like protein, partial [Tanacetum coccineum]
AVMTAKGVDRTVIVRVLAGQLSMVAAMADASSLSILSYLSLIYHYKCIGFTRTIMEVQIYLYLLRIWLDVTNTLLYETVAGRYPSVKGAKVVVDTNTGCSNGYGFVRFADDIERTRAMNEMMVSIVQAGLCVSVLQLLRSHLLNNSMDRINFLLKVCHSGPV